MPRYSEAELTRIKNVPLELVATSRGYVLEKRGKDFALSCPFHEEKTASCIITPSKNLFHCFGCGEGGSVIDWVMKTERVDFRTATASLSQNSPQAKTCPLDDKAQGHELLTQVSAYYHEALFSNEDAMQMLRKRGLDAAKLLAHFNVGVCDRSLGTYLPVRRTKAGDRLRDALIEVGAVRKNGHEHLRGCITVPFPDENNEVAEIYGRKITANTDIPHLYLPGRMRAS